MVLCVIDSVCVDLPGLVPGNTRINCLKEIMAGYGFLTILNTSTTI